MVCPTCKKIGRSERMGRPSWGEIAGAGRRPVGDFDPFRRRHDYAHGCEAALTDVKKSNFSAKIARSEAGKLRNVVILAAEEQQRCTLLTPVQCLDRADDQVMIADILDSLDRAVDPRDGIFKQRHA